MKYFLKTALYLFCAAFIFTACEGQFDSLVDERLEENPVPDNSIEADAGQADFSNYIAIGNSLTAGYMDGALYDLGQQNSIPALLADQLALAGGADTFNQPDINSELGFNTTVSPNPAPSGAVLGRFKLDTNIPGPSPTVGGQAISPEFSGDKSALDNFGVPGILLGQLLTPATGGPQSPQSPQNPAFNPFYKRFASAPGQSTILGDAVATQPTFFTLWIGNNDVLGFAASGGSKPGILTSPADFDDQFNAVIDQLINKTTANGVVVTIPPVTVVPFFRAVPFNAIALDDATATQLNQAFGPVNAALQAVADNFRNVSQEEVDARMIAYQAGANPILANDPELNDFKDEFDQLPINAQQRAALVPYEQSRPLTQGELVTLSAGSVLGTPANPDSQAPTTIGVVIPLGLGSAANGDEFYLTLQEQGQIQTRTVQFNTTIATAVAQNSDRLALYDINAGFPGNPNTNLGAFADLFGVDGELGIRINGTLLQPDFSPNGVFSTDGVHPNPRGSAIIANEIIDVIEQNFGSTIPDVDVLRLPSVQICAGNCVSQQGQGEEDS
jgi:lysophospholipase L1-like esterase